LICNVGDPGVVWEKEVWIGMEGYIDQIFRELPFGIAIAMVIFLGILLIIWLLLPLWVLFIQWNTGKIKDEIRNLVDQLERRERNGKEKETAGPND
jgi:dolichol kinase